MQEKDTTEPDENISNEREEISFKYVKANFFRVIHADGAWGGLSPRGDIHIAFYNERAAIPDYSTFVVNAKGKILEPEQFEAASKLVREVEADIVIDLITARALRAWLSNKIEAIEERLEQARAEVISNAEQETPTNSQ